MAIPVLAQAARQAAALATDPTVRAKVADYYQKATGAVANLSTTQGVQAAAARGSAPAAVLLKGFVRNGVNPDDIFADIILREQLDHKTQQLLNELRVSYGRITAMEDSKAGIKGNVASLGNDLFEKKVIQFAQRKFGTPAAIRETHALMRAFLDMDTTAVERNLSLHLEN